jgi:hypothetical protein
MVDDYPGITIALKRYRRFRYSGDKLSGKREAIIEKDGASILFRGRPENCLYYLSKTMLGEEIKPSINYLGVSLEPWFDTADKLVTNDQRLQIQGTSEEGLIRLGLYFGKEKQPRFISDGKNFTNTWRSLSRILRKHEEVFIGLIGGREKPHYDLD